MQNVITYEIEWSMSKVDNYKGIYYVPFKIIAQTVDKSLESFCLSNWPQLMYDHPYSNVEMREFLKMQFYLKKELSKNSKLFTDGLYSYFDAHGWFLNIKKTDNIFHIDYDYLDCKMWNDKIPHLQVHGIISANVNKVIDVFDKNKWIAFTKYSNSLLSEKFYVQFIKNLPALFTFQISTGVDSLLFKRLEYILSRVSSNIFHEIKLAYKVDHIEKYKKTIEKIDLNRYQVTFNNFIDVLKLRTKNNKIATAAAIYYTAKAFQNKKQQNLIKKQMNKITFKNLLDLKKAVRRK